MAEETEMPAWRKKFIATRMVFESILFERELMNPKKEKLSTGLLGLAGIWLFSCLLLAHWVFKRGYFFTQTDTEGFGAVLRYAAYLKSQGFWALIKPELSDLTLNPPLYCLSYVPVLKYLTSDLNTAMLAVNSFFLLVLALAIFFAVRKSRPNRAGWLGAAFALALPFVVETARHPSPELALIALVAAMYSCYVNSDDFEDPKWTFYFSICMGLGFFAHRFFWLYTLPLIPFIMTGVVSPMCRDSLFKGFFPAAVVNLPWYVFSGAVVAAGLVPLWGAYEGFWHYLRLGAVGAGLPLFGLGALALTWMYFSVFMPYEKKKIVAAWFWVPYLVLAWGVRGSRAELLYPALLPFAVALPVMTPHQARRYLLVFVLALGAVNQSGFLRTVSAGAYPIAGLPLPPSSEYRADELAGLVAASVPPEGGLVGIYGSDSVFNSGSLRFFPVKAGVPLKFVDIPACPGCAAVLLHKTARFGEKPSAGEKAFQALAAAPWFPSLFEKKADLAMADTSSVEVYAKLAGGAQLVEGGSREVKNLAFGPLTIADAYLKPEGPGAGAAAGSFELFAPVAEVFGGDIYGLTLDLSGLRTAGGVTDPFVPAGVSAVKVKSAKISAYAIEQYLVRNCPFLTELKVELKDTMAVSALSRGRPMEAEFELAVAGGGGVLEIKPVAFALGPVEISPYLLRLFTFRLDFSDNPYGFTLKGLRVKAQMLELY